MTPNPGDIVRYYFFSLSRAEDGKPPELVFRPAIVQAAHEGGVCDLFVFFKEDDIFVHVSESLQPSRHCRVNVAAHQERERIDRGYVVHDLPTAELGVVERQTPKPHTWSWPRRR